MLVPQKFDMFGCLPPVDQATLDCSAKSLVMVAVAKWFPTIELYSEDA